MIRNWLSSFFPLIVSFTFISWLIPVYLYVMSLYDYIYYYVDLSWCIFYLFMLSSVGNEWFESLCIINWIIVNTFINIFYILWSIFCCHYYMSDWSYYNYFLINRCYYINSVDWLHSFIVFVIIIFVQFLLFAIISDCNI